MKKLMWFFLLLMSSFLINSCDQDKTGKYDNNQSIKINVDQEKLEISKMLDNLATAYEGGNFDMIKNIWLPSEDVLAIGTENGEKLEGWKEISAAIKKQLGSFEKTYISITDQSIWLNKDATTAWFYEELNYNFVYEEKAMKFTGIRFTGVMLKQNDGSWRLVQQHMSIPSELEMVAPR